MYVSSLLFGDPWLQHLGAHLAKTSGVFGIVLAPVLKALVDSFKLACSQDRALWLVGPGPLLSRKILLLPGYSLDKQHNKNLNRVAFNMAIYDWRTLAPC